MEADARAHHRDGRPHRRWIVACLVLAAVVPYLGILDAPFVFDDVKLVAENEFLRAAARDPALVVDTLDITSRRWDDTELRPNYRPLRFLSYLVDYKLSEWCFGVPEGGAPRPFFFHLTNVLFHVLNTLLVAAIAAALFAQLFPPAGAETGASGAAAAATLGRRLHFGAMSAGLLFALHPLATEAVTYVSGRRDVMSTCFFLAALWLVVRDAPLERPRWSTLVAVPALFVAGLLTKEMVITLAPAVLLVECLRRARWSLRRVVLHSVLWALTCGFIAVTLSNQGLIATRAAASDEIFVLTACRYLVRYLGLLVAPLGQTVDYSYDVIPPSTGLLSPWTTLPSVCASGLLVAGGVTLACLWLRGPPGRRRAAWGLLALGLLWFAGTLVPVLQFVPIAERFAERFAYLPGIGIVLVGAGALECVRGRRPRLAAGLLFAVSLLWLAATVTRNRDWQTPLRLWTAAVEAAPRSARAHLGRANALKAAGRPRQAVEEYSRALEIFRERPEVSLHRGYILQALTLRGGLYGELGGTDGRLLELAITDYSEVLASTDTDGTPIAGSPRHTAVQFDLAQFLLLAGRHAEAASAYRGVIEIGTPASLVGAAHYYLGKIALAGGDRGAAARSLERAWEALPEAARETYRVAVELVDLYLDEKDLDAAARVVETALERGPSRREELLLLLRRARIADRRGELARTVEVLSDILARDPDYVAALVTLAGIEATKGQVERARERYRRALELAPAHPEAQRGLKMLRVREEVGPPPPASVHEKLAAFERKGVEHLRRVELTAAREVFAALLEAARQEGSKEYEAVALRGLGGVEGRFGRFSEARAYLEAALELEPRNAATLLRLGDLVLRRFDDTAAARDHYLRYLGAVPEGVTPEPRVYVNLAQLTRENSAAAALEYCLEARRLGYDLPALERTFGDVYAELGEWEKALDAFNRYLDAETDEKRRDEARRFVRESVLPNL